MTGMDRGVFSIDCTFILMATVSPFANVVIDDVIVRTHKKGNNEKQERGNQRERVGGFYRFWVAVVVVLSRPPVVSSFDITGCD
jgi:hypothetical protein